MTPEQKQQLTAPLDRSHVKQRKQSGRSLSYVEGWHAIAEANRIFGFDAWTRETMEIRCVSERERPIGEQKRPGWGVSYIAKVRVTVTTDNIVREGIGAGHGIDVDLGLAHESAIKEAETDAMKRALMTFGNPFGLALYDKTQANVVAEPPAPTAAETYVTRCKAVIAGLNTTQGLRDWWAREAQMRGNLFAGNDDPDFQEVRTAFAARGKELAAHENTLSKEAAE